MARFACLMYHELGRPGQPLAQSGSAYLRYVVPEQRFREQVAFLHEKGFRLTSVSEAITSFDSPRIVAITFDDGCETDLTIAAPILKKSGVNATFYVVSGFIGKRGYLSREQLRELSASGFEIGCHSRTHPNLAKLDRAQLYDEVSKAKAEIEEIIGREACHFSCPGGFWSKEVVKTVASAGFATMATSRSGLNSPGKLPYGLARNAVYGNYDPAYLEQVCIGNGLLLRRGAQYLFDSAKILLGESRYRRIRSTILGTSRTAGI